MVRRKRALDTKGMRQLLHCIVGSVFFCKKDFKYLYSYKYEVLVFSQALMYLHLFLYVRTTHTSMEYSIDVYVTSKVESYIKLTLYSTFLCNVNSRYL